MEVLVGWSWDGVCQLQLEWPADGSVGALNSCTLGSIGKRKTSKSLTG